MGMLKGKGRLRHHFWGDYCATIAIEFSDEASAKDALSVLSTESLEGSKGWKAAENHTNCLIWFGKAPAFNQVKAKLVSLGADADKIDSCATSIDYGEPFEIAVSVTPAEQPSLF
jgi:hypothetical protein